MSVRSENVVADMSQPDSGQPLSVRELIRQHHGSLMHLLRRRMRVAEDAADVAQEAYVRMLQYEGSRELHSPFSMLVRIAINLANDLGRSEQVRRVSQQCSIEDIELAADTPTPEHELAASQDLELLMDAVRQLPPRCRQVFLLSRAEHMTYAQIAAHCGISVKMVEKHISHALAFCAERVGGAAGSTS